MREGNTMSGEGAEREGDTESNAGSRLCCQHRVQHGAWTHELWDHDLSRISTLNWLSHPGALNVFFSINIFVFMGKYPVVQWLDHRVVLFLTFWGTSILFFRVAAPVHKHLARLIKKQTTTTKKNKEKLQKKKLKRRNSS